MCSLAVAALLLLLSARADAEFPVPRIAWNPLHYSCVRAPEPVVVDGRLDDPAWEEAAWTEPFVDIQGSLKPAPRFRTRVKMLWDDTFFYVAAELEEPDVWATLTERDAVIYHDNDFEVFIDPDGDNHEYYELEINALGTEWDLLLVRPYRDGGPAVHAWDIPGLESAVHVDGTLNRSGDVDRGWTVEIAFPWTALAECAHRPSPPNPGDRWRVNFSRVQWRTRAVDGRYEKVLDPETGEPLPEDNWVWSPQGLIAMHYPEMWGLVTFADGGAAPGAPSPAERAGWELMRLYYAQRAFREAHGRWAASLEELSFAAELPSGFGPVALFSTPALFEARTVGPGGRVLTVDQEGRLLGRVPEP